MSSTQSSLHPAAGNADALSVAHQDSACHLTNTSLTPSVLSDVGNTNSGDNRQQPKGLAIFFGDFISHAIDTEDLRAYVSGSPGRSHFTLTKNAGWSPSLQDHVLCHPSAKTDGDLMVCVVDLRSQELVCILNYSFNLTISSLRTLDNVGAVVLTTSILEATTISTLGSLPNLQSLKVIAKRRMSAVSRPSLPLFHNLTELEVEGRIRDACRILKACFKSQSRVRKFCACSSLYESTERLDKLLLDLCPKVNHVSIIVLPTVKRKMPTY